MESSKQIDLGLRLKASRAAAGLSVKALTLQARSHGYRSVTPFYDAESGRRAPTDELLAVYREICGFDNTEISGRGSVVSEPVEFREICAALFRPIKAIGDTKEIRFRARKFKSEKSSNASGRALSTAEEILDASLYLISQRKSVRGHNVIYVLQRSPVSVWTDFEDDRRALVPTAIRGAVENGCRVVHLVASALVQKTAPHVLFQRYADLQRLRGDYEYSRDDSSPKPGATDTIIRPGVGLLHAISSDPGMLSVDGGNFFFAPKWDDYIVRRAQQAEVIAQANTSPFRTHDPSGRYAVGPRRVRIENALADIERLNGDRIMIKDGPSDLLAPRHAFRRILARYEAASPSDERGSYWKREAEAFHAQRLESFRSNVESHRYVDVIPKDSFARYFAKMASIDRNASLQFLSAIEQNLLTYPNYRLIQIDDSFASDVSGTGIGLMMKTTNLPTTQNASCLLYYESDSSSLWDPESQDSISVSFDISEPVYRDGIRPSIDAYVRSLLTEHTSTNDIDAVRSLRKEIQR